MPIVRIALAQVNPTVGDLAGNAALVRRYARAAADAGAQLVAFPEMVLTGYPVEDLVFRRSFVAASRSAVERLAVDLAADGLGWLPVVVGYLDADDPDPLTGTATGAGTDPGANGDPADDATGKAAPKRGPRNAAALLSGGAVVARYFKHHLPNYGVFDEDRYFVPGERLTVLRLPIAGLGTGDDTRLPARADAGSSAADATAMSPGTQPEATSHASARGGAVADSAGTWVDVALTICEDLWQAGGPFAVAGQAGVGLVVNINGSPYELDKDDVRLPLVRRRAAEAGATIAYVNLVGGQDELLFDGDSMIVSADGELLARAPQFTERLVVHDLEVPAAGSPRPTPASTGATDAAALPATPPVPDMEIEWVRVDRPLPPHRGDAPASGGIAEPVADEAEVWQALVLGLRDYVRKNGFGSVVLGLSGGIDSSVVAAIAVDALGPARVVGVSMPSQHSSEHSRDDAAELAKRTGLDYRTEPIQEMVDAFLINMSLSGLAVENLQARVRGVILMALSNQEGHLVLTTGNKSELAVGYSTLYGDSVGGFNPIKDVPKTLVWRLAQWRNADAARRGEVPPIPENSISKPPSAELRPGQLDTDSLPDYPILDAILSGYIDGDLGRDDLVAAGHDPVVVDRVLRMVDLAEYKRRQSAPGTKISIKAFGRDRRLPITNRFREKNTR